MIFLPNEFDVAEFYVVITVVLYYVVLNIDRRTMTTSGSRTGKPTWEKAT